MGWKLAALGSGLLVAVFALVGLSRRGEEVNGTLAAAAREAVALAREATERNDTAYIAAGRSRLFAVVLGTSVPVAGVAAVAVVLCCRDGFSDGGTDHERKR